MFYSFVNNKERSAAKSLLKVYRFIKLYGFRRTIFKSLGRSKASWFSSWIFYYFFISRKKTVVTAIGCGQFSFATIGAILTQNGYRFSSHFDIDIDKHKKFKKYYRSKGCRLIDDKLDTSLLGDVVYIASNHASHTSYAIECLQSGRDVYIEKPISVNWHQFHQLNSIVMATKSKVFVGYNRPFSQAIKKIRYHLQDNETQKPFSFSCFISGHFISPDHWYRNPGEGTRVCGNLGHWIDLYFHILFWRKTFPKTIYIQKMSADKYNPDDNLTINMCSDSGDICSIMLTARSEPFEGINETINFQQSDLIAKIDDFKSLVIWKKEKRYVEKYGVKDPGHKLAIMQPFNSTLNWQKRWLEVKFSTIVMLKIKEMVENNDEECCVSFSEYSTLLSSKKDN